MKNLYYILVLFLATTASSQDFTLDPIPVFVEGLAANQPLVAFAEITNHTDSSQVVVWQRLFEDIPLGWDAGVCTSLGCFLSDVSEGTFPMIPLESLNLDVQFETNGIPGSGRVEVKVFLEKDSTDFVIGIYEANATTVNVKKSKQKTKINLFPNPCEYHCYISNDEQISSFVIYTLRGTVVKGGGYDGTGFFVGDLNPGIYFISFLNNQGERQETVSFVKL